ASTFVSCSNNPTGPVGPSVGSGSVAPVPSYVKGAATDYAITSNNGSWSITPKPVTLTGGGYGPAAYDGDSHSLTVCNSSASTFVSCSNNPTGPVGPSVGTGLVAPVPS